MKLPSFELLNSSSENPNMHVDYVSEMILISMYFDNQF